MINRHNNKFSVSSAISAVNEKTKPINQPSPGNPKDGTLNPKLWKPKPIALANVGSAQRRTGHAKLDGERTDAR